MASNFLQLITGTKLRKVDKMGQDLANKIYRKKYDLSYRTPKDIDWRRMKYKQSPFADDKERLKKLEHLRAKTQKATTRAQVGTGMAASAGVGAAIGGFMKDKMTKKGAAIPGSTKFFKRLGDLYTGKTSGRLKKIKKRTAKDLTNASNSKANQSVVDRLNKRYDKVSKAHAAEIVKRTGLYGMTGVAGISAYKTMRPNDTK